MPRDETYEMTVNCDAYNENVALASIDVHPNTVVVTFENKHEIIYYSRAEAKRMFERQEPEKKAVRRQRFRR